MGRLAFPYAPGAHPGRVEYPLDRYDARQEVLYQALNTVYYAWVHGLLDTLHPTPGLVVDVEAYTAWQDKAIAAWQQENNSRGKNVTRGIVKGDFPEHAWRWLYEAVLAAPPKLPIGAPISMGDYD